MLRLCNVFPVLLALSLFFPPRAVRADHAAAVFGLRQQNGDGTLLATAAVTASKTVRLTAYSDQETCSLAANYWLEVEVQSIDKPFTNTATNQGAPVAKPDCVDVLYSDIVVPALPTGSYKWQARERTTTSGLGVGPWVPYSTGTAFVVGPVANVSPASLDFGDQRVGKMSGWKSVSISAQGGKLTVTNILAPAEFIWSGVSLPLTIAAGTSTNLNLAFLPSSTGNVSGTLGIVSDGAVSPLNLPLHGHGAVPELVVSPGALAFPSTRAGTTSSPMDLTLTNKGLVPLTVSSLAVQGANASHFVAQGPGVPFSVAPAGVLAISLAYAPPVAGASSAVVHLGTDDGVSPNVDVPLSGTGLAPSLVLSSTSLDFGGQLVGRASMRTLTLSNNGTADLTIRSATLDAQQGSPFALLTPLTFPLKILPGAKQTWTFSMVAPSIGKQRGQLTLATDDAAQAKPVLDLVGNGLSSLLAVAPQVVDFGSVPFGASVGTRDVVIKNTGSDDLELAGASLSGSAFTVAPPSQKSLAPGASANVTVSFVAFGPGSYADVLVVKMTDVSVPNVIVGLSAIRRDEIVDAAVTSGSSSGRDASFEDAGVPASEGTDAARRANTGCSCSAVAPEGGTIGSVLVALAAACSVGRKRSRKLRES